MNHDVLIGRCRSIVDDLHSGAGEAHSLAALLIVVSLLGVAAAPDLAATAAEAASGALSTTTIRASGAAASKDAMHCPIVRSE